jgi:hypothetical protein
VADAVIEAPGRNGSGDPVVRIRFDRATCRTCNPRQVSWVCALLGKAKGHGFTTNSYSTVSSPVFLLPQWFTGLQMITVISLRVIPHI